MGNLMSADPNSTPGLAGPVESLTPKAQRAVAGAGGPSPRCIRPADTLGSRSLRGRALASTIDHTLLEPGSTPAQVKAFEPEQAVQAGAGEIDMVIDLGHLKAGVDFVKTCTGFSGGGATTEDIALMRQVVGPAIRVKASVGIRTLQEAEAMIAADAYRLGTSSGVASLHEALRARTGRQVAASWIAT